MNPFLELFDKKRMPLIMSLPVNDADLAKAAFRAGADAVKVHISLHHNAGGETLGSYDENREVFARIFREAEGPVGIVPGADCEAIMKDAEQVKTAPFDFISFYTAHLPTAFLPTRQCLMAAAACGFTAEEVSQYEALGAGVLEASVMPHEGYGRPLSFADLVTYRQLSLATRLPMVVPTQRRIEPSDVEYLCRAGVSGLMIGAIVTGKTEKGIVDAVKRFRRAIDAL
ncbi:MAG: hypothetical protein K5784_11780 [Clostridiales bacterium]|nr:hypothetical protein [Clostridiales bacterium]